jgi:hypothetical protein
MIPPRTLPGQRFHIPLFTKLMVYAGVDESFVRTVAKMAYNYRRVYLVMELWYMLPEQHSFREKQLRLLVKEFSSFPWYRRAWIRIQWFLEGIQDDRP